MTAMKTVRYGASPQEWTMYDLALGLTADLLPVVSNPNIPISPDSKIRERGKVPSLYNRRGQIAGVKDWAARTSNQRDVERWSGCQDYGICIQTRAVRAIDIDVPDPEKARAIETFITNQLGNLPRRWRANSSKSLFALRLDGELAKRVIRVREKTVDEQTRAVTSPAWQIEFLANGQQFIAAGTHNSGARIEWDWGGLTDFPVVDIERFDLVWAELVKRFGLVDHEQEFRNRRRGESLDVPDELVDILWKKDLALDTGKDGQIFIECPWSSGHSMDSGITQTAYFPRGSGGYELGHFKCMHAGCAHRTDSDFEEALGLHDDMFEVLPSFAESYSAGETGATALPLPRPAYSRTADGRIEASLHNVGLALTRPDQCGMTVRYDRFRGDDMVSIRGGAWRPMTDSDQVRIRKNLERLGFRPIRRDLMSDALLSHSDENSFDTAVEWASSLPEWDGVPRVRRFFTEYFGAEDTPYIEATSRYLWSALAGRVVSPGIKADMVPVLSGLQGARKSSAICAIVPWEELFAELDLGEPEDKVCRLMRGKIVAELVELRGMHSRELEAIKAFIVRRVDSWVPKYRERAVAVPRRILFIGTTNYDDFLVDETGERRFLPMKCRYADVERIVADRLQLWAEGLVIYITEGIAWREAEQLAKKEHERFTRTDSWEDDIRRWLTGGAMFGEDPGAKGYIELNEVLREALQIPAERSTSTHDSRVAKVLRRLGWVREQMRVDGVRKSVYITRQAWEAKQKEKAQDAVLRLPRGVTADTGLLQLAAELPALEPVSL